MSAPIPFREYAVRFSVTPAALLREVTAGSVGRWTLVATADVPVAHVRCEVCGARVTLASLTEFPFIARCGCDAAAQETAWRAHFGALTEIPAEAWGEPAEA